MRYNAALILPKYNWVWQTQQSLPKAIFFLQITNNNHLISLFIPILHHKILNQMLMNV